MCHMCPSEKTTWSWVQANRKLISSLDTTLCFQRSSAVLSRSWVELSSTKNKSWFHASQLARTARQKWNHGGQKNNVSIFREFSRTMDCEGLSFCPCFCRWCCLYAGFPVQNASATTA